MNKNLDNALNAIELALRKFGKFSREYCRAVHSYHSAIHRIESQR